MSAINEIDIECEACGHAFKGSIWTAVHAGEDPELRDLLLGGELNLIQCPSCSYVAYQDHFLLYQDPAVELVAYVYPVTQQVEEPFLRQSMLTSYREAQTIYPKGQRKDYEPLLVFGLETLVERITAEERRLEESLVARAVCEEHGIPTFQLRPSVARRLEVPPVLPLQTPSPAPERENLLHGTTTLTRVNPALGLYVKFKRQLLSNPEWSLTAPDQRGEP